MVLSNTVSPSTPTQDESSVDSASKVQSLPFSLINLLKCSTPNSIPVAVGAETSPSLTTTPVKNDHVTRAFSPSPGISSIFPILRSDALKSIFSSPANDISTSLASSLLKTSLAQSLSLSSFDPLAQLTALKILQEKSNKIRSSIAVPVPVRVAPYPTSRPSATTSPVTSPITPPHTRHSSSEESLSISLPYSQYSPFNELSLYKKEFLLEEKNRSAFQQVSVDTSTEILRNKLHEQVISGMTQLLDGEPFAKLNRGINNFSKSNHICKYCEKTFPSPSHLLIHLRTHSGERPYPCPGCGKTFATRGHLRRHYRIHTGVKPYKCQVCGKAFANQGNLKTHTRLHTGEKPYKCPRCDKAFADAGNLQRHITTHTGIKPYKCLHCQKAFSRSSNLKTHLLTHTGLKPFSCTCCNKSFTRLSYLKAHMKGIRHSDKVSCPSSCNTEQQNAEQAATPAAGVTQSSIMTTLCESHFTTLNPYSVRVI